MTITLLPKARLGVKKKTISASVLRELKPEKGIGIEKGSKKESYFTKLKTIRDFFLKKYESDVSSFRQRLKMRQDEKRRIREERIEEKKKTKKESKSSLVPKFKTPGLFKDIFSSIGNFLLFLSGGIIFNNFLDLEKSFAVIVKSLDVIGGTIKLFASAVSGITNFIDSAYKGYDKMTRQISDITGLSEEQINDFLGKFNKVINGTIIAAMTVLRTLPRILKNKKPPQPPTSTTTNIPKTGQFGRGMKTGIDLTKGTRTIGGKVVSAKSAGRYTASVTRFISGKANAGDMMRLVRRGFFKPFAKFTLNSRALKVLPYGIGSFIEFIIQYFVFKEPAGRAAFKSIGAGLFGFLGGLIGGPFAIFTGIAGAYAGGAAAGRLYDGIFGDNVSKDVSGIGEQALYDQITETRITAIQPIVI